MEKLKKVSRTQWCLFALLIGFAFLMQNCQDDDTLIYDENQTETELNAKPVSNKVDVCRYNARKGTYSVVSVVAKRVLEGDVILDADGDGYFKENLCGVAGLGIDCDDTNSEITRITSYRDVDGDGFGNPLDFVIDCTTPSGYVDNNLDCNDTNPDLTTANKFYLDYDGDGFGNLANSIEACVAPDGYVTDNTDCDDYDIAINPDAIEICGDNMDNNCDGFIDEGCIVDLTEVPDDNFEAYLETHNADGGIVNIGASDSMGNGINNDGKVFTEHINKVTSLSVNDLDIYDLTGIGGFAALEILHCGNNYISSLDLSQNTALITLVCAGNLLKSIDVSNSANLDLVDCNTNLLEILNLGANTALTYLACSGNQITELDMSANDALLNLQCNDNKLIALNISGCSALEYLSCDDNNLSSLNLTNNNALVILTCSNNNLNSINTNSKTSLQQIDCYLNQLTSLDVSDNINLTRLWCYNNYPSLTCIKVNSDQSAAIPSGWWKDSDTVYDINCPPL